MSRRRFVLLDRDGTIIVERHYLTDPNAVELLDGAGSALRRLADLGLGLVVVTNQSALARGLLDPDTLDEIHRRMAEQLRAHGVELDAIYHCPHHPDESCACRKPRTGMVDRAAAALDFDATQCFVVGDTAGDMELGRAVGATTLLVRTGYGAETAESSSASADHVADDLGQVADIIAPLVAG